MGSTPAELPYGTWPSPIDAATAASHDGSPDHLGHIGEELWWTAPRPAEGGRRTLVRRRADGTEESALPTPWNVRNSVMGYGGFPWTGRTGAHGPLVVFTHFGDQRLYAVEPDAPDSEPRPLTPLSPLGGGLRWCEPVFAPSGDEVWCVLEEFTGEEPTDLRRVLAAVPLDGSAAEDRTAVRELTDEAHRFVTGPKLSPDGTQAVWLAWDHPRMPWDGTELRHASITPEGTLTDARTLIGGPGEAVAQAEFTPEGALLAATERGNWWNLHRVDPASGEAINLCPREEETGGPLWKAGMRWFAPLEGGLVAMLHGRGGNALGILDPAAGTLVDAVGPWTEWSPTLAVHGSRVAGIAAGPVSGAEIVELDTGTGRARVVAAPHHDAVDPAYYPVAEERVFTGPGGRDIHVHLYPPHHPEATGPAGTPAPYVMWAHGGPTGYAPCVLDLEIAYFTSRGIGVAEVNYGGSAHYGKEYRERLREQWGIVDVEDCAAVAQALADEGLADPERLAVRGGSAGGWTTGASLVSTDVYACGTILYPILDLTGWATSGTHDFESQYLEGLIGPLAEVPERYEERSPANHPERVGAPFVLLQGLDDPICPPVQCERFLAALASAPGGGVPHAYLTFEGEGHGFRRLDTLVRALEAELSLYAQTFGFEATGVPQLELRTAEQR
ncbi:prolyl oligopeptidase family serine peptidase [Streptomyces sp. NPDC088923]|uniref:prolyl oligopeptidase family serine peptidase n=1 Tax=Streptomyces sp. NPDC088923 TaxID=3365913 RepID=UPI003830457B